MTHSQPQSVDRRIFISEKEPEKRNNHFSERRGGGGAGGDRNYPRDQNHGGYGGGGGDRGGGGGERGRGGRYQDNNSWSRQNERAGQKPPRFQQQAQRMQQRQQGLNPGGGKQQMDLNSSYSTWSTGAANDFNSQWGSFSGLANDPLAKDIFQSSNDDVGQWKMPPEPKNRRRPDEVSKVPYFQQQKAAPGTRPNHFSDVGIREQSELFGDTNHIPFSGNFRGNFQQPPRNNVPSASALSGPCWEWHEGDKCMAKYWEDNRVS